MDEGKADTTEVPSLPTECSRVTEAGSAVHRETGCSSHCHTAGSQEVADEANRGEKAESHYNCAGMDTCVCL